jgi:hypothetical protein
MCFLGFEARRRAAAWRKEEERRRRRPSTQFDPRYVTRRLNSREDVRCLFSHSHANRPLVVSQGATAQGRAMRPRTFVGGTL